MHSNSILNQLLTLLLCSLTTFSYALTYIGQSIEKDSKWYKQQGPYIITIDLSIYKGATLEIEPGTQIFFAKETFMTVAGNLIAKGRQSQKIRFAGLNGTDWGGFVFTRDCNDYNPTTKEGVCFEYCRFEGSGTQPTHLIQSKGCKIQIHACQITHCYTAILLERQAECWLSNSVIEHCNRAIDVKNTSIATIEKNKMTGCNSIRLGGTTTFKNNILKKFTGQGRHSGLVVWMKGGGKIKIINNQFIRFDAYAFKLEKTSNRSTLILQNNNFKHNHSNLKLSRQYFNKGNFSIKENNFFNYRNHHVSIFGPKPKNNSAPLQLAANYWGKSSLEKLIKNTVDNSEAPLSKLDVVFTPLSTKAN